MVRDVKDESLLLFLFASYIFFFCMCIFLATTNWVLGHFYLRSPRSLGTPPHQSGKSFGSVSQLKQKYTSDGGGREEENDLAVSQEIAFYTQ